MFVNIVLAVCMLEGCGVSEILFELMAVIIGKWSDVSVCFLLLQNARLYNVLDTMVLSGEDVCRSDIFDTIVGVSVLSVM